MTNFKTAISKLLKKGEVAKPQAQPVAKPSYDFVEQYILMDPNLVLNDYEDFSDCEFIPVAHENANTGTAFKQCVKLKTNIVLPFLRSLKKANEEVRMSPTMRMVTIIKLNYGKDLYILPNLKDSKEPLIYGPDKHTFPLYVTPEINRAFVEQYKKYIR